MWCLWCVLRRTQKVVGSNFGRATCYPANATVVFLIFPPDAWFAHLNRPLPLSPSPSRFMESILWFTVGRYVPCSWYRVVTLRNRETRKNSEISVSHGGEYEDGCLLGCCATSQKTVVFIPAAVRSWDLTKLPMLDVVGCNAAWTCRQIPTFRSNVKDREFVDQLSDC
jgi:hypothetical protein